ncbi:hypothetical protein MRX96_045743 [Rhipicephalus microplus]
MHSGHPAKMFLDAGHRAVSQPKRRYNLFATVPRKSVGEERSHSSAELEGGGSRRVALSSRGLPDFPVGELNLARIFEHPSLGSPSSASRLTKNQYRSHIA